MTADDVHFLLSCSMLIQPLVRAKLKWKDDCGFLVTYLSDLDLAWRIFHVTRSSDLDLPWRMLHVARSILEKSPGSTMEKVEILATLAEVSMQGGSLSYLSYARI
jgi:hypothetical protein